MRRWLRATIIVGLLLVPAPATAANPVTCAGYPQPREFRESQDWWTPIPVLGGTGHIHLGMCFPTGTVSGVVTFDVRVLLHDNLVNIFRIKMQDDFSTDHVILKPDIQPVSGGLQTYWFQISIDTRDMPDGYRLFRWYAFGEHANGNRQVARAGWPLNVENGGPDHDGADPDKIRFLNWYIVAKPEQDFGYTGPVFTPTDDPRTWIVDCATAGPAIDRTIVHLNPDFHAKPPDPGTVLANVAGEPKLTVTAPDSGRLVARCRQEVGGNVHEGVGVMPIR